MPRHMKVLILTTKDIFAIKILRSLAVDGIKAEVMSPFRLPYTSLSRYGTKCVICSKENLLCPDTSFAGFLNSYCSEKNVEMIIPADVISAACLAELTAMITAAKLFPISTISNILLLNNKWRLKQLLDQLNISTPKTTLVQNRDDVCGLDSEFPVIIKTLELDGGLGMRQLNSIDDILAYLSEKNSFNHFPLLVQEYVPGVDMGVSTLSENGKVLYWTIQKKLKCGSIEFIENPDILDESQRILSALKYTGLAHFDMRLDSRDNSIKFFECNPRFWDSLTASVFAGVNFAVLGIYLGLGHKMPTRINYCKGLRFSEEITYMPRIKVLISRQVLFNPANLHYFWVIFSDILPMLFMKTKRIRTRLAKIFIPGRIRFNRKKKLRREVFVIPPLSAIETYSKY